MRERTAFSPGEKRSMAFFFRVDESKPLSRDAAALRFFAFAALVLAIFHEEASFFAATAVVVATFASSSSPS